MKEKNRADKGVIITAVILAAVFLSAVFFAVRILLNDSSGVYACIYSDGKLVERIRLDNIEGTYTRRIETGDGGYNTVEAKKGKIHVSEASCPDKVCINTGYISSSALPVSCLPNKLIIKIEGEKDQDNPDIIVY